MFLKVFAVALEWPTVGLLCIVLVAFLLLSWRLRRHRNLPPGPWGWPIVGYLPNLLISLYRRRLRPYELVTTLGKKHGEVYSMYIGWKLVVVLNKYHRIKEGFQNPYLNDRPKSYLLEELGQGEGIAQASGEVWKQQRHFTLSTMRSLGVGKRSFEEKVVEESDAMIKEMTLLKGKPFDPRYFFSNATANIICSVIFGNRFEYSDPSFKRLLDLFTETVQLVGAGGVQLFFPLAKYSQSGVYNLLKNNFTSLAVYISNIVESHRSARDADNPNDYIDVYLNEIDLREKLNCESHVNVKNLIVTTISLFGAGTETTATTLRWGVLYMMAYPEIQDRIQKEIDAVVGRNRLPKLDDKEDLPFTSATLLEIQRISSVLPLGIIHYSSEETSVAGYTIPKGSVIISNLWAVHHDSELWQDPHEFNPERFLNKDGIVQQPAELIPFSTGRRMCIGENLAKMELFVFFSHMLHQFTFKKPDDSPPLSFDGVVGVVNSSGPFLTQAIKRD